MLACVGLVLDPLDESGGDLGKGRGQHLPSRDNDIVVSVLHCKPGGLRYGSLQPAAHAIALHCVAMFLGDGKSDARRLVRLMPVEDLEKEGPAAATFASTHGKKLRPAFQPPDSLVAFSFRRHRPIIPGISALSRETSAAACTTGSKNLLTTLGSHTGAESMTTLANKLGRLVGTLHFFNAAVCGPS
jgi:hypothetical protein